jgi:diguanylate cyclase (GGDEF)-like protein
MILDFCSGGFFLGFKQPNVEIPLEKNIKIRFTVSSESGNEDFEIDARAVHLTPTGVGVTADMPVSAFNALTKKANYGARTVLLDKHSSTPNKLNQENCKHSLKQLLIENLPLLLINFFDIVGGDLEKAKEHSQHFTNRSLLDDLLTTLQLGRESFVSEFCSSVISQVEYISKTNQNKEDIFTANTPLALIDKDEFDDWLNMSAVIRKLNNRFEDKINQLTRELSRVFGRSKGIINNPISPAILCDNFREIILQFELNNNIRRVIYNTFNKVLIDNLDRLYEQSNTILLKYDSADTTTHYSSDQPNPHLKKPIPHDHRLPDHEKITPIRSDRQPLLTADHKPLHSTTPSKHKNIQPISQVAGKLIAILNELNTASPEAINKELTNDQTDSIAKAYSSFSSEDVVAAILKIQHNIDENHALHRDSTTFNKRLQDALKNFGKGSKSLSGNDAQHLEIYGKFFETLFNKIEPSSAIKPYLEKIHLPLLSLALQGNDFIDADTHPVRNILNQLAILESAVKDNKVIRAINIKDKLDHLVERIVQESSTNPDVFTEVEQELADIVKQVTKSTDLIIKRIVETYDGQQKFEATKRLVQQEIDRRIGGRPVPAIILQLLKSGWQQLLVIAELNKEKRQEEKLKYLTVIDDLTFWFYEQESILKIQASSIQKTLAFIADNLKSVCPDALQRNNIIDELTASLLGVGNPKVRKRFETIRIEPEKPAIQLVENSWTLLVDQLRVGEWLMISSTQGFEPMKLVWIGDVLQVYVFVNRNGLNALELSKSELAERLRIGAAHKMENLDTPLMDRATNSMLQNMHEKLIYNATHDPVTELFTRDEFVKQLKNEMTKLGESQHMLCHIEILDFRVITNICGVEGGEQLLKRLAQLTTDRLSNDDLLARLGDNSFAILFKHCSADEGYEKSKKLKKLISDSHFHWQEKSFAIGVSIGLVPFGDNSFDIHQLLQQADSASISAERSSQNRILIFTNEDENLKHQNKLYDWIGHIDDVFSQNRLFARCQMIAPIERGKNNHQHYEILLGVRDEAGGIIPPDHFIPAVERCKRMPEIDQWIISNVFGWIETNRNDFDKMDGFSINLSGQSINSEEFLAFLKNALESSNIPTEKLTFEITETVASENLAFTKRFIATIKQFGCKFSLDDFGSGYSSYSYLKNLNVDYLKIDGAFVKDIAKNKADIAIVKSMNEIAHSLDLKTIAEYVENDEIRAILIEIGVDYGQGYGIQKPIPLTELAIQTPETETYLFENDSFWGL